MATLLFTENFFKEGKIERKKERKKWEPVDKKDKRH